MVSLYPDLPGPRAKAIARDAVVIALLIVFVWLGFRVYHDVDKLSGFGKGLVATGHSIKSAFSTAASALGSVPIAGGALAGALRDASTATGNTTVQLGRTGEQDAHTLAVLLGLLIWGIPSLLLLLLTLPGRIASARRVRRARLALTAPDAEQRQRLLAVRAVLTLPDETLFAYTADPGGDLAAGRFAALASAQLEAMGIKAPERR
jgi:hypothetical protein